MSGSLFTREILIIEITFPFDSSSFALHTGYRGSLCTFIHFAFQIIIHFYFIILNILRFFPIIVLLVWSILLLIHSSSSFLIDSSTYSSTRIHIHQH
jgi:hypothetical protein